MAAPTENGRPGHRQLPDDFYAETTAPTDSATGSPINDYSDRAGVFFPRTTYDGVYVDTSSWQGIANASNPYSPTWQQVYLAGGPGRRGTIPGWTDDEVDPFRSLFVAIRDAESPRSSPETYYEKFVSDAVQQSQTTGEYVSPFQLAQQYAMKLGILGPGGGAGPSGGGGGGGGGAPYGGTSTSYQYTTPQQAKALVDQALTSALGRAATAEERSQFMEALRQAEEANPTTVTVSGSPSNSTRTQSGGIDPSQFALDWAMSQEGSGEYRAATKYMDFFLRALGG